MPRAPRPDPGAYGDRHAPVYDRIYGDPASTAAAVAVLAETGARGGVLDLGVGTGRLARPLAALDVPSDGIDGSERMLAELRTRPSGDRVTTWVADLADFSLPRHDYGAVVCAVSTLFMLEPSAQQGCVTSAARHLRAGGLLFVEAFVFDQDRYDREGRRLEQRNAGHFVRSVHDPAERSITIDHHLDAGAAPYTVRLFYRSPEEIDALAECAGLRRVARWHDWSRTPARIGSRDPVSVYRRD